MGADDADGADGCGPASSGDGWLAVEVMYIVRVRARPSFLNSISTPILRRKVAARRSRPDNDRGLSGQVLELTIVLPVPADAPAPPATHPKLGRPTRSWSYPNADGKLIGCVLRFDPDGEKKEFRPQTLWRETLW